MNWISIIYNAYFTCNLSSCINKKIKKRFIIDVDIYFRLYIDIIKKILKITYFSRKKWCGPLKYIRKRNPTFVGPLVLKDNSLLKFTVHFNPGTNRLWYV